MTRLHHLFFALSLLFLNQTAMAEDGMAPPVPPVPVAPLIAVSQSPGSLWNEVGARTLVGMNGNARRVGDLIIPVLDPEGKDREAFLDWVVSPVIGEKLTGAHREQFAAATEGWSAAGFAALRSELKAKAKLMGKDGTLTMDDVMGLIGDLLPPAIGETRRYQTLQALVNCTRRSLMPNPDVTDDEREAWSHEIRQLEAKGIR